MPTFSDPTEITNPLFPISNLHSALLVGKLKGQPWMAETTLLPQTKVVDWNGQRIETLQSQFVAYVNGRIFEVAVDLYAQADDGSVWYFGEDAFTYKNGLVSDTEGTWRAGEYGRFPAMIMPAHPQVGDVYRTENIPGLVFEQVTVKEVGKSVIGPTGPVDGAMIAQELHMDERRLEEKTFAPGYGEFFSGSGQTFEANALAVPVEALPGPTPPELVALSARAYSLFDAARSKDWSAASAAVKPMARAWDAFQTGDVPRRLGTQMSDAVGAVAGAVGARNIQGAAQAALDVARAGLDLQLRYRTPVEIDLARLELWSRQLLLDAGAKNRVAVAGDAATMEWIRERIPLDSIDAARIDDQIRYLEAAAQAGEFTAVRAAATRLRLSLPALQPTS